MVRAAVDGCAGEIGCCTTAVLLSMCAGGLNLNYVLADCCLAVAGKVSTVAGNTVAATV